MNTAIEQPGNEAVCKAVQDIFKFMHIRLVRHNAALVAFSRDQIWGIWHVASHMDPDLQEEIEFLHDVVGVIYDGMNLDADGGITCATVALAETVPDFLGKQAI